MANITASMVKELREMTGAGMMECKKALAEAEGDLEKAVDVLRTRGLAAVAKKAGRATNEGTVMALVSDDCTVGAVVELNCETDFVGMNEKFKAYAEKVAKAAIASKAAEIEALMAAEIEGETVEAVVTDCIHVMGENTQLARVAVVEAAGCGLLHPRRRQDRRSGFLRRRGHRPCVRGVPEVRSRRRHAGCRRQPGRRYPRRCAG